MIATLVLNVQLGSNFSVNPLFPLVAQLCIRVELEGAHGTEGVPSEDSFSLPQHCNEKNQQIILLDLHIRNPVSSARGIISHLFYR